MKKNFGILTVALISLSMFSSPASADEKGRLASAGMCWMAADLGNRLMGDTRFDRLATAAIRYKSEDEEGFAKTRDMIVETINGGGENAGAMLLTTMILCYETFGIPFK